MYSSIFVIQGLFFYPFPPFTLFLTLAVFLCGDISPSSSFLFLLSLSICPCCCFQCSRTAPSYTVWMLPSSVQSSALQFCYNEHHSLSTYIKLPSAVSGMCQPGGGGPCWNDLFCGAAHTTFPAAWGGGRGEGNATMKSSE